MGGCGGPIFLCTALTTFTLPRSAIMNTEDWGFRTGFMCVCVCVFCANPPTPVDGNPQLDLPSDFFF